MSAALGNTCNIPMIMRTLSTHLFRDPDGGTIIYDTDFMQQLLAGVENDHPSALAESYFVSWWTAENEPPNLELLQFDDLKGALEHHKAVTGYRVKLSDKVDKRYSWSQHSAFDPEGLTPNCNNCRLYRAVSLAVKYNLQDIRHLVHGVEMSSQLRGNLAERRAAGFFQLYDAVSGKEMDENLTTSKSKSKSKQSTKRQAEKVRVDAAAELARLKDLPSLKWTWGTELTSDEVRNFLTPGIPTDSLRHSGYDTSLPEGRCHEDSPEPSSVSSNKVSNIAEDNKDVPELDSKDIPTHFNYFPFRQDLGALLTQH
jgi:hypothetical protein